MNITNYNTVILLQHYVKEIYVAFKIFDFCIEIKNYIKFVENFKKILILDNYIHEKYIAFKIFNLFIDDNIYFSDNKINMILYKNKFKFVYDDYYILKTGIYKKMITNYNKTKILLEFLNNIKHMTDIKKRINFILQMFELILYYKDVLYKYKTFENVVHSKYKLFITYENFPKDKIIKLCKIYNYSFDFLGNTS
jgi:hypothetical protein